MAKMFDTITGWWTPEDPETGKGWVNNKTGTAYIYLAGKWIPFAGSSPWTEYFQGFIVLINGNDRTQYVKARSLRITDVLTSQVDTCSFIFDDIAGTEKPDIGQDVTIYFEDSDTKIFGGNIQSMPQNQISPWIYTYSVKCTDYSRGLNKKLVVETYEDKTCGYIIADIVSKYCPEFTTANVQAGLEISFIAFNYKTVNECLKNLANLTKYDWYVDYDKDIHFFVKGTETAPYELNETATSGRFKDLTIEVDKTQLKNRVYVRGGFYLSDLYTQYISADGKQLSFLLAYTPYEPMSVYVGGVQKTSGIDNIDKTGKDFVVNVNEKTIKNLDYALIGAGVEFKVTYKYKIPILFVADDEISQAAMVAIEGGDGIYEDLITDSTIETLDAARERAAAELLDYSNPIIDGEFSTDQYGYRSGQLLTVNIPSRDINSQYIIQSVTKTAIGGGQFTYTIKFATKLKGLIDFLIYLINAGKEISTREDEVIDEFLQKREEALVITDNDPTFEEATPPFVYGPTAGTVGKFNESTFG